MDHPTRVNNARSFAPPPDGLADRSGAAPKPERSGARSCSGGSRLVKGVEFMIIRLREPELEEQAN